MSTVALEELVKSEDFWDSYIPLLIKRLNISDAEGVKTPEELIACKGWGTTNLVAGSWSDRVSFWFKKGSTAQAFNGRTRSLSNKPLGQVTDCIPLFDGYVSTAVRNMNKKRANMKDVKRTAEQVVDANKEAVAVSLKLATGRTANTVLLNKLVTKMPWYTKLFGKKKAIESNALAKIVGAQLFSVGVKHFADSNSKLNYLADAMLQDAMVDLTVNSAMLTSLLNELESSVTMPSTLS